MGVDPCNSFKTETGSVEWEELDNAQDSEDSDDFNKSGEEGNGSDDETTDNDGISGDYSGDDLRGSRVDSGFVSEEVLQRS